MVVLKSSTPSQAIQALTLANARDRLGSVGSPLSSVSSAADADVELSGSAKSDPSRPDPSRPDPSRPDPPRPDPSRPDPSRPDPSRPAPGPSLGLGSAAGSVGSAPSTSPTARRQPSGPIGHFPPPPPRQLPQPPMPQFKSDSAVRRSPPTERAGAPEGSGVGGGDKIRGISNAAADFVLLRAADFPADSAQSSSKFAPAAAGRPSAAPVLARAATSSELESRLRAQTVTCGGQEVRGHAVAAGGAESVTVVRGMGAQRRARGWVPRHRESADLDARGAEGGMESSGGSWAEGGGDDGTESTSRESNSERLEVDSSSEDEGNGPSAGEPAPRSHRVAPRSHRVAPRSHRVAPRSHRVAPRSH